VLSEEGLLVTAKFAAGRVFADDAFARAFALEELTELR
jgi:hypothetical protein